MLDTPVAIAWRRSVLHPGGAFVMDDFVGETRWQWTDKSLGIMNEARNP